RSLDRARAVCVELREALGPAGDRLHPRAMADSRVIAEHAARVDVVLSCGAAGVSLTSLAELTSQRPPQLVMDLNAVPPLGIEGVEGADRGVSRQGVICYGAFGVGGRKMKLHKRAIQALFTRNDLVLDADELLELGQRMDEI
ncbi:MAG TPA: bifunctional NADP-dependent methylenetetrahydromethanopterin dehydrogenase/methylenetetrahydrofolate dehydrogenase, partial [Pirellulaceae bacterium]